MLLVVEDGVDARLEVLGGGQLVLLLEQRSDRAEQVVLLLRIVLVRVEEDLGELGGAARQLGLLGAKNDVAVLLVPDAQVVGADAWALASMMMLLSNRTPAWTTSLFSFLSSSFSPVLMILQRLGDLSNP